MSVNSGLRSDIHDAQGRVTVLEVSRWTCKGGSYRAAQRFFISAINWEALIKSLLRQQAGTILIADGALP